MAIVCMCSEMDEGAYADLEWTKQTGKPIYMKVEYEGCVISTGEHNGYDDSDFYAIVYDPADDKIKKIIYGSTRYWSYANYAAPDLTVENAGHVSRIRLAEDETHNRAYEAWKAATPEKGKKVELVRKHREFPAGLVGEIFYFERNKFGFGNRYSNNMTPSLESFGIYPAEGKKQNMRVGVRFEDGRKAFMPATKVKVIHV